ncbi:hypothetical protein Desgi_3954 [Desulfoscipio gibsoniae DSM 7213]|uniref:Uncharacterized protein n=1 Tax=Desulfoscipio gibsoniae DSM 7213 TaxID=767817 RepID=R4KUD3_9FIRM|nr:hypothetical protein Desgi_3954 [Desulfoscipio gibsoniae DSM 7213]
MEYFRRSALTLLKACVDQQCLATYFTALEVDAVPGQ